MDEKDFQKFDGEFKQLYEKHKLYEHGEVVVVFCHKTGEINILGNGCPVCITGDLVRAIADGQIKHIVEPQKAEFTQTEEDKNVTKH